MYVLDERLRPVPVGVAGELYIGGVQVGRGYLNRPELSAERFVRDPFSTDPGARLYKTGDLGRWRADGAIEYLGRNDFQVKLRGLRIELGEIEARLAEVPGVQEVAVLAREDQPGDQRLVAYTTGEATADALRAHVEQHLPSYMVPAAYVGLPSFPLSPNGKLDRKALPAPDGPAYASRAYEAPQGELEALLAALWQQLLQREQVGRHDNFFELGGHSLLAVRLVSRLRKARGVDLPLAEVFEAPVLHRLADRVAQAATVLDRPIDAIPVAPASGPQPVSPAQRRLWFLAQMDSASRAYHVGGAVRLQGRLDVAALQRALQRLVARHAALRTCFALHDGEPMQQVAADAAMPLLVLDLREAVASENEARLRADAHSAAAFDLVQGPPLRVLLMHLRDEEHVLQVVMHHLVADGWSTGVFLRELGALYTAFVQGVADPLQPLALQYTDYAAWQRQAIADGRLQRQAAWWREALAGAPALLELSTDRPRPAQPDHAGATVPVVLDPPLVRALRELGRRHGTTLFMTLLTSWGATLSRLSGQDEVVIGTPVAGRQRPELEPLIGFFVNTLALRLRTGAQGSVGDLLAHARAQVLAAQQHQDLPFDQVVEGVNPARSLAYTPLFQVMLDWQNAPGGELHMPGLALHPV